MKRLELQRGFTITELAMTMGMFAILIGVASLSIININRHTSVTASTDQLISDIREQQVKAMVGDSEGRATADIYGIYFGVSTYTLFHGSTYSSADPANFIVSLEGNLRFATPGATLLFSRISGEVVGYAANANTVTIQDSQSQEKRDIIYNRFGVVRNVQ